nr:patatin-like phospholipase family protein [Bradyrhizobium sp. LVM 105]
MSIGDRYRKQRFQSLATFASRPFDGSLDARHFSALSCDGHDVARLLTLQSQSVRPQSAACHSRQKHRLRTPRALPGAAVRCRYQRPHWPRAYFFAIRRSLQTFVLMASACLPTMFQAVEIDGEFFWDGGYVGNPTITPLVRESDAHDTILVQINPREDFYGKRRRLLCAILSTIFAWGVIWKANGG